jgi:hypothetical protein
MDDEPGLDERLLQRLIDCRDTLLFELCDQHPPPEPYSTRLWEAQKIIAEVVEAIKRVAGVEEPLSGTGWTIYSGDAG